MPYSFVPQNTNCQNQSHYSSSYLVVKPLYSDYKLPAMLKSNSVIYYTKMLPYCLFQDSVSSGSAHEVNTEKFRTIPNCFE